MVERFSLEQRAKDRLYDGVDLAELDHDAGQRVSPPELHQLQFGDGDRFVFLFQRVQVADVDIFDLQLQILGDDGRRLLGIGQREATSG